MVTLADLVQTMLLPCDVAKCAHVLNKYLKTTLFSGNSYVSASPPLDHHNYSPNSHLSNSDQKVLVNFIFCWINSEQLAVLRDSGRHRSIYPEDTPMAKVEDIARVILQLRTLVSKDDEQIQQLYQYAGASSKRQRTN